MRLLTGILFGAGGYWLARSGKLTSQTQRFQPQIQQLKTRLGMGTPEPAIPTDIGEKYLGPIGDS